VLDRARIDTILEAVVARLDGEWLLIGGALVATWLEPRRVTEDVDIMGMRGTAEERYALMELADALGLPVEAVNSAADFFVRRVDGWRSEIEILRTGSRSTLYRPTITLFVILKMGRLSERDLEDCRAALLRAKVDGSRVDTARLLGSIDKLPAVEEAALRERRAQLREWIASIEER
jgi:hypothetical protein